MICYNWWILSWGHIGSSMYEGNCFKIFSRKETNSKIRTIKFSWLKQERTANELNVPFVKHVIRYVRSLNNQKKNSISSPYVASYTNTFSSMCAVWWWLRVLTLTLRLLRFKLLFFWYPTFCIYLFFPLFLLLFYFVVTPYPLYSV